MAAGGLAGEDFAVVVIEIDSPSEIKGMQVSDFQLRNEGEDVAQFKRVERIDQSNHPDNLTESGSSHYLDYSDTTPWDGIMHKGKNRIRIKAAFAQGTSGGTHFSKFKLVVGHHTVEGSVEGQWVSG